MLVRDLRRLDESILGVLRVPQIPFKIDDRRRSDLILNNISRRQFLRRTEGSAIRRIGFERWRRNLAVALGNALRTCAGASEGEEVVRALAAARDGASELVREHIDWALAQARASGPGRR